MKIIEKEKKNGKSVNYKGFGKLPKSVMFDTNLTPEAKAEYALLCSYAGNSDTAYPSRNLMVEQLDISLGRFYRHFDLLLEYGYIIKEQHKTPNQQYANNIYILTKNFESAIKGYGFIPKAVMTDENLDIMSKAIYSYMCCFKDPHTNISLVTKEMLLYHMDIVESTYYKYFRPLVVMGYITVEKKPRNGHFPENIYILNDIPQPQTDNAPPAVELPNENTVNKFDVSENTDNSFQMPENCSTESVVNENAALSNAAVGVINKPNINKTNYNTTFPKINQSQNPKIDNNAQPHLSIDGYSANLNVLSERKQLIHNQAQLFNAPPAVELPNENTVNKFDVSENTDNSFQMPENCSTESVVNENAALSNAAVDVINKINLNKTNYNTTFPKINQSQNPKIDNIAQPHLSIDDYSANLNVLSERKQLIHNQANLFKENAKSSYPAPTVSHTAHDTASYSSNQNNSVYNPYNVWNAISDHEINGIRRELADNNGDLHCFFNDNRKMAIAIRALFDASSASAVGLGVYDLIVSSTLKMASVALNKPIKIGSGYYDRNTIINILNEFIQISPDGLYFFEWADSFASYYSSAVTKYNIRSPIPYTQASIMHYLCVDYPLLKVKPAPPVEERHSSFDIDLFFKKAVDKAMNSIPDDDDDDDLDVG